MTRVTTGWFTMPCNSGVLRSDEFVGELNGGLRIFEGRSTSGFMQLGARTEFIFTMEIYLDLHTGLPLNGNSALQIQLTILLPRH
jgi:hypothetical protein